MIVRLVPQPGRAAEATSAPSRRARIAAIRLLEMLTAAGLVLALPLRLIRLAFFHRRVRSIWTGAPIITMALNARCERELGVHSSSLVLSTYFITQAFDYNLSRWRSIPIVGPLLPYGVFLWLCVVADRVHAYCDGGILPQASRGQFSRLESVAYRLLGIDLFLWTYGADVRTRPATLGLGEPNCCTSCDAIGRYCVCDASRQAANLASLARGARAVFAMGDMLEYTPGSRNDLFFWPVDLDAENGKKYQTAFGGADSQQPLRVVHAPNHRIFKGTDHLEAAVAALRAEGLPIELVLVEKVPNATALDIYRSADVVFDQCLIGFHGYFALEAMALGKPVMCFIRKPAEYLLAPDECPIINVTPATLKDVLRGLSARRHELDDIGRRGRSYIERHFTPSAFAARLGRAYRELGVAS